MVEKIFSIFFEIDHLRCIFAQKYDSRCQNSLKCKNFGQFHSFVIFVRIKGGKNKEYSYLRLFLAPGIEFLGKIHGKWSISKKLREFFRPFFDKNAYFRHNSALESNILLTICLGSSNHLSKSCKISGLYLRVTAFSKVHHFFGAPCT